MQALALRTLRPATAACFVAARPRSAAVAPARRLSSAAIRAQAEDESKKDVPAAAAPVTSSSAVAPRGASWEMMPSWSRMNQVRGVGLRSCSSRLGRWCRCPPLLLHPASAGAPESSGACWSASLGSTLPSQPANPSLYAFTWCGGQALAVPAGCQHVLEWSRCCFRRPLRPATSHLVAVVPAHELISTANVPPTLPCAPFVQMMKQVCG